MDRRLLLSSALACPLIATAAAMRAREVEAPKTVEPVPAYPPSPIISEMEWAPPHTILRQAKDGDNWPLTWADDNALYTTFGDGTGFPPKTEKKLSCGSRALLAAQPTSLEPTFGPRQSNSEMAGRGRWAGASFPSREFSIYGSVTLTGKVAALNWHGLRNDGPRADTPADQFILMRAPKNRLTERSAWEFFVKAGKGGQPLWDRDVAHRGAAFSNPDACLRSAMTYQAGLRRYLLVATVAKPEGRARPRGHSVRGWIRGIRRP